MQDIYNNAEYLAKNPDWHSEDAAAKADAIARLIKSHKLQLKTILEVGCGSGEVLSELNKLLSDSEISYSGYDISADALKLAESRRQKNINFRLQDITKEDHAAKYDLILAIDVLEHIPDYFAILNAIANKSTYAIFHIPLDMFVWSLFREKMLIESKERVGHIHNFTEDFILSVLNDFGLQVFDKVYTEPDYKGKGFKQKLVNSFKKLLFRISPRFCSKTLGGYSIMVLCKSKT